VGRSFAVVKSGPLHLTGFLAWVMWLVVHIFYLIGFRNRMLVMLQWAWAYVTHQRSARLITCEAPSDLPASHGLAPVKSA
jgi:NADH dehydrogenase